MSNRQQKRFRARGRSALVAAPVVAIAGVFGTGVLAPPSAGASPISHNSLFNYTDDSGHAVQCQIKQTIDHKHNGDNQLTLGSTTLSLVSGGLPGDCTGFTSGFCQQASWTDPFGNSAGTQADCRVAGNGSPISLEYAPDPSANPLSLTSSVHFTHCVTSPQNVCDASFTFTK